MFAEKVSVSANVKIEFQSRDINAVLNGMT